MPRFRSRCLLFFCLALPVTLLAQTGGDVKHLLETSTRKHDLILRDFPGSASVEYRWHGGVLEHDVFALQTPGALRVKSVKVHDTGGVIDGVVLTGERRVLIRKPDCSVGVQPDAEPVSVRVDLHGAPPDTASQLVELLFYPDVPSAIQAVPPQWQRAVPASVTHTSCMGKVDDTLWLDRDGTWTLAPTSGVVRPRVTFAPEPEFSEEARHGKVSGNVLIGVEVTATGTMGTLWLLRTVGHGLDAKALAAVSRYEWKPATVNGEPVGTVLQVEVNFQIF